MSISLMDCLDCGYQGFLPFLSLLLWARPILLEAFYFSLVERDKHVDDLLKLIRTKNVA